jgi:SlyX protein
MTDLDTRLMNLEIKASFTEDLVERLDQVIISQQRQIDLLINEVRLLRLQAPAPDADNIGLAGAASARDELPPHY